MMSPGVATSSFFVVGESVALKCSDLCTLVCKECFDLLDTATKTCWHREMVYSSSLAGCIHVVLLCSLFRVVYIYIYIYIYIMQSPVFVHS